MPDVHATGPNVVHSHPLQSSEPFLDELRDCQLQLKKEKGMHRIDINVKLECILITSDMLIDGKY